MHDESLSPLARLTELERRYDGPIPESELRALRFGSALAADIADARREIAFFRELIVRTRRAGKERRHRDRSSTSAGHADLHSYLASWRERRQRLARLLQRQTAQELERREARIADSRRRTLEAIAAGVLAPLVDGPPLRNPRRPSP